MLDQQDRHVKMVSYKANGIHQLLCLIGVHTCCRLIQKKKLGICGKCSGDLQLTLFTIREVSRKKLCFLIQVKHLQDLHGTLVHFFFHLEVLRKS